jgi:Flp pilus assembly protein TadG
MASLRTTGSRWSDEAGAELIEFALVLPLLMLMLLAIIDFGMLFQRYHVVTNAAREGARVSVLPGYSDEDVEGRVAQYLTAGGLTETPTTTVGPPQSIPTVSGQCITVRPVTVVYPYQYSAVGVLAGYWGGGFSRSTLEATSTMRSELAALGCS